MRRHPAGSRTPGRSEPAPSSLHHMQGTGSRGKPKRDRTRTASDPSDCLARPSAGTLSALQEVIRMDLERIKARSAEIAEAETPTLLANTGASKSLHARAIKSMPGGVASNFQAGDPYPVYLEKGKGSRVWDVDGTEYKDFHGGFGVNVVGHAHPKIVEALTKAASNAIHFAVTTPDTIALAEAICERFQLEQMRFVNSGTEATMDAIRVARAATGRDKIIKMEGSYHGHHDSVLFSVVPEADVLDMRFTTGGSGDQAWYSTEPTSKGVPEA